MKTFLKVLVISVFFVFTGCNTENLEEFETDLNQRSVLDKETCETAFAYDKDNCFIDHGFKRWGWFIGPLSDPFEGSTEIYAAAGKCDIDKGFLVGTLNISYQDGTVDVTYIAEDGYAFYETHLYVGNDNFPSLPNGKPTVAPGQYGNYNIGMGTTEESYKIDGLSGDIYIIAHAVACEYNDVCEAEAAGLKAINPSVCLENGEADLMAEQIGDNVVPDGYQVLYVLTKADDLTILDANDTPNFTVNNPGEYRIHTLVYDPNTLDLGAVSTGIEVNELLIQGGGSICGSLDVEGAFFKVDKCD